jgi:hypothetical protein
VDAPPEFLDWLREARDWIEDWYLTPLFMLLLLMWFTEDAG